MGLEGDIALESRLVSRTIESAQSRVEGYNFDIRKRVVEYDDVINKQRETIYAERDKVLRNEDLTATVRDFVDNEIDALVGQYMGSESPQDWDFDGLSHELTQMGLTGEDVSAETLADIGVREDITEHLRDVIDTTLEKRESELGEETWAQVERLVLLRTIDALWVDHLTELDDMRRGIGLRGYAGTDPLNEFKREAYKLYEEFRGFISKQVANNIFRVQVQQVPQQQTFPMPIPSQFGETGTNVTGARADQITPVEGGHLHSDGTFHADAPPGGNGNGARAVAAAGAAAIPPALAAVSRRGIQFQHGEETASDGAPGGNPAEAAKPAPVTNSGPKIGRNDPCWCGSGKKYKRCHGS
jgi:preprotein translocase subunit SecA